MLGRKAARAAPELCAGAGGRLERGHERGGGNGRKLVQRAIALRGEGRIEDAEAVLKDALARFPLDAAHRGGVCCDGGPSGGLD